MPIEQLGVAGMTAENKQFYNRKLLSVAELNLVFHRYGEKRPIPARGGNSIEFRRFEKITVTAGSYTLTEGTPPTVTQATISTVTATISQYGQYSQVSDMLELQSIDPVINEFVEKFGIAMAEGVDIVVRDVVDASTTVQYADAATVVGTSGAGAVGSGNYLDAAEILEARRTLRRNNAKYVEDNKYICIVHPDNAKDLFEDPDIFNSFKDAADRGGANPLFSGVLGDWMGVRFVETTNLNIIASNGMSGADIYEVVMFGKEAYAVTELSAMAAKVIVHPRGTGGHTDPLEQYSTIGWKTALAAVRLNNTWLIRILCASSRSNAA